MIAALTFCTADKVSRHAMNFNQCGTFSTNLPLVFLKIDTSLKLSVFFLALKAEQIKEVNAGLKALDSGDRVLLGNCGSVT